MSISLHQKYHLGLEILRSWVQTIQTMYPPYEYIKTSVNLTTLKISLGFEHLRSWVRTLYPSYVYTFVLLEDRWFKPCTIFIKKRFFCLLAGGAVFIDV